MRISTKSIEMLLAEKRLTKAALAKECGLHRQNLCAVLKRGTCEPKTAGRIAAGLCVSVSEIMEQEDRT